MDKIKLILGTMTLGPQVDASGGCAMINRFLKAGYFELDTAYVYNDGKTEIMLGSILKDVADDFPRLATKVHPRITGKLDGAAVTMQLYESLNRLCRNSIDILYFHFPDSQTPIGSALEACAELYNQGKFKELGLSNFPAWMVVDIWHLCKERGWPKPSVYQGMYNGLTRGVESELFPALQKLGMRFYAFNPLAGGMLSGKHTSYVDNPMPGRFARLQSYRDRYWKKSYFEAINVLAAKCRESEISFAEAAYRWLAYHSHLDRNRGDGIIIGASSLDQLEQNLATVEKGALPEKVVDAFDVAWKDAKAESPCYFKYY